MLSITTKTVIKKPHSLKINWKIFEGSSHLEEGLADFAAGQLSYPEWIQYCLPGMKYAAKEIKRIRNLRFPIKRVRKSCARWAGKHYGPGWRDC